MSWINKIVNEVFKNAPYSKETEDMRKNLALALEAEAARLRDAGEPEHRIIGDIIARYGTIEEAGRLLGVEDLSFDRRQIVQQKEAKRAYNRYAILSVFAAFFVAFAAQMCLYLIVVRRPRNMLSAVIFLVVALVLLLRLKRKKSFSYEEDSLTFDAVDYLRIKQSAHKKRLLNTVILSGFLLSAFTIQGFLGFYMGTDTEFWIYLIGNANVFLVGLFLLLKNGLRLRWINRIFEPGEKKEYRIYLIKLVLAVLLVWAIVFGLLWFLPKSAIMAGGLVAIAGSAILFLANFKIRAKRSWGKISLNKRRATAYLMVALVCAAFGFLNSSSWYIQPYISTIPYVPHRQHNISYNEDSGVFTIVTEADDFKILQLTDIHLGGSPFSATKDHKALKAVYALITETLPDLVIVTGDLVFPMGVMSFSLNNYTPIMQFASFMRNIGIPWAFAYGNHDTEAIASNSAKEVDELFKSLSYQSTQNLLYPQTQPTVTGRNNQIILIEKPDGALVQAVFILDSNEYAGGGFTNYDTVHSDQVEWYEENILAIKAKYGEGASSLIYMHIPVEEYKEAYDLYKAQSPEVEYFFGIIGEEKEAISISKSQSRLFERAVEQGSTKAIFVGHDHYNNLSLEYQGIRLTYGMSIDYLAMPSIEWDTEQRGGTLVTLLQEGQIEIKHIKLTEIEGKK